MRIDVEEILRKLEKKANEIYVDGDRVKTLINAAKEKIEGNKTLREIWDDLKLLLDLIRDWMKGDYKEISKGSTIMIIISLLYLVTPIDLIPDFIPGGFVDDLAVFAYVIKKISEELKIYRKWKDDRAEKVDNDNTIEVEVEIMDDPQVIVEDDILNIEDIVNEE